MRRIAPDRATRQHGRIHRAAWGVLAGLLLLGIYQSQKALAIRSQYAVVMRAVQLYNAGISIALREYWMSNDRFPANNAALNLPPEEGGAWPGFRRVAVTRDGRTVFEPTSDADGGRSFTLVIATHPANSFGNWVRTCGGTGIRPAVQQLLADYCAWDASLNVYVPPAGEDPAPAPASSDAPVGVDGARALPGRSTAPSDAVLAAIGRDDPAALAALQSRGLDLCAATPEGQTPLAAAVRGNQSRALSALLAARCAIDAVEPFSNRTPLMLAAMARDVGLCRQLLTAGADPAVRNADGEEAWFLLGTESDPDSLAIRTMLLVKGLDANRAASDQTTLLMRAADTGKQGLVEWLFTNGAKIDLPDGAGRTALMHAVLSPAGENLLPLLLARGARLDLRDAADKTALALAQDITDTGRRDRVVRALRHPGQKPAWPTTGEGSDRGDDSD